jgi:predicted kinase
MATLYLMCGLPCSGKTTLAKELEHTHAALRLTPDEWHTCLFGQDVEHPEYDSRHNLIEAIMWEVATRAVLKIAELPLGSHLGLEQKSDKSGISH